MENKTFCNATKRQMSDLHTRRETLFHHIYETKKYEANLELARLLELVELGLHLKRLVHILQKLTLEGHDFVDVAEEGIDFSV
jgi:hypothetical protein